MDNNLVQMDMAMEGYGFKTPETMVTIDFREDYSGAMERVNAEQKEFRLDWATQKQFENFISNYRLHIHRLYLFCPKLIDLSPLAALGEATHIYIEWNQKATTLWNISKNTKLKELSLNHFNKLYNLQELSGARQINGLQLYGGLDKKWKIESLEPLKELNRLSILRLLEISIDKKGFTPLYGLKQLKRLDMSHNIFNTEDYARLAAVLENTVSDCFSGCIYNDFLNEILVVGKGKRALNMQSQSARADYYVKQFNEMTLKFRSSDDC